MKIEVLPDSVAVGTRIGVRPYWMVVDDDEAVTEFLASMLEALGIADVQRFNCPTEALAAFVAQPNRFQLVITDLEMPGMNGIELCRRLREVRPGLKVVLATGSGIANEVGVLQCGFCGLLAKPFPAAQLWRTVEAAGALQPSPFPANN